MYLEVIVYVYMKKIALKIADMSFSVEAKVVDTKQSQETSANLSSVLK